MEVNFLDEREYSMEEANLRFFSELKLLGLESHTEAISNYAYGTYKCDLFKNNVNEDMLAIGYGKGDDIHAQVSAQFEALEDYTSNIKNLTSNFLHSSFEELKHHKLKIIESKLPKDIFLNSELRNKKLAWLKYNNSSNKNDYIFSPAASINRSYLSSKIESEDHFPYQNVYMQSSNSGAAIGCSFNEAFIHSITELIERDAFSFFIMKHFLHETQDAITCVDTDSLPEKLKCLIDHLKKITGVNPTILLLPNEVNLPCYCTCISDKKYIAAFKGLGASLNPTYALERSILECIQEYTLAKYNGTHEIMKVIEHFSKVDVYLKCIYFNVSELLKTNQVKYIKFKHKIDLPSTIDDYRNLLELSILSKNFSIYYNIIHESKNVCTIHSIIPEAEDLIGIFKGVSPHFGNRATSMMMKTHENTRGVY